MLLAIEPQQLLNAVHASQAQLKEINSKHPSDPVYYCRTLLKMNVHTVRREGVTVYMDDEHFKVYSEGLKKETEEKKAREAAAKAETPKEAVPQTPAQVVARAAATPAAARV